MNNGVQNNYREFTMTLKYEVTSLDDLDATLHGLYVPTADNSKYVLNVEGVKPLDEFNKVYSVVEKQRNDERQLKQTIAEYKELGMTATEIKQNLSRIAELEELAKGTTFDEAKLDAMANARTLAKTQPMEAQLKAIAEEKRVLEEQVSIFKKNESKRRMFDEVSAKIKAAKVDQHFEETLMMKAERDFIETDEGKFLSKEEFLPVEMWLTQMQVSHPHYWGNNIGGGAKGSGAQSYMGKNPFTGGFNGDVTEQMRLLREQPALAAQLQKAAGV
jgi:hypothetical protein